jgi:hypothetical protein
VEGPADTQGEVLVLLCELQEGGFSLRSFTPVDDTGTYSFVVTAGKYVVAGFEDRNHSHRYDPGEPAGAWGRPDEISVAEGVETTERINELANLSFPLDANRFPLTNAAASVENSEKMSASLLKLGQVADWGDPAFDYEHGSTGFWKPMTFLRQHGVGIYFMQPCDRKKIPVLFVHGAVGTPRGWKTLADSLDQKRL